MPLQEHFPWTSAVVRALTGRWARRIYLLLIVVLLAITTAARLRVYFLARKAQEVLHALAAIQIDQTTEEQLNRLIPNMEHRDWEYHDIQVRNYHVKFTNEKDRIPTLVGRFLQFAPRSITEEYSQLVNCLGYRYFNFAASVSVERGKVTVLSYGLANQFTAPRYTGLMGYLMSARSVHGSWRERLWPFSVSSEADFSPQYRPGASADGVNTIYAADAPREITDRLFQLDLSCFWGFRGCDSPRQIAPRVWADAQTIQHQTDQQLSSGKCPDSIVEGRMKYLPDVAVSLLEVSGSRRVVVNQEGDKAEDWFTDYKVVETLRGRSVGTMRNIRFRRLVRSPEPPRYERANNIWPETKIGAQVLYFSYPHFNSCRFIPATPSAVEIVRRVPVPPKHWGDQVVEGLL